MDCVSEGFVGCSGGLWHLKKVLLVVVEVRLVGACREYLNEVSQQWGFV